MAEQVITSEGNRQHGSGAGSIYAGHLRGMGSGMFIRLGVELERPYLSEAKAGRGLDL